MRFGFSFPIIGGLRGYTSFGSRGLSTIGAIILFIVIVALLSG